MFNLLWPIAPWVHQLVQLLGERPQLARIVNDDGIPRGDFFFEEEEVIVQLKDDDSFEKLALHLHREPITGKIVPVYAYGVVKTNWRERRLLEEAVFQWLLQYEPDVRLINFGGTQ